MSVRSFVVNLHYDICYCGICNEILSDPQILECKHSFCKSCLSKYAITCRKPLFLRNTYKCPDCSARSNVDQETGNPFLVTLFEMSAVKVTDEEVNICGCKATANWGCVICQDYLCEECLTAHGRLKITRDHAIIPASQFANRKPEEMALSPECCKIHPGEKRTFFCRPCGVALCRTGSVVGKCPSPLGSDRRHECVELSEVNSEYRGRLHNIVGLARVSIRKNKKGYAKHQIIKENLHMKYKVVLEQVNKQALEMETVIQKCSRNAGKDVKDLYEVLALKVKNEALPLEAYTERMTELCAKAQVVLEMSPPLDFLEAFPDLKAQLEAPPPVCPDLEQIPFEYSGSHDLAGLETLASKLLDAFVESPDKACPHIVQHKVLSLCDLLVEPVYDSLYVESTKSCLSACGMDGLFESRSPNDHSPLLSVGKASFSLCLRPDGKLLYSCGHNEVVVFEVLCSGSRSLYKQMYPVPYQVDSNWRICSMSALPNGHLAMVFTGGKPIPVHVLNPYNSKLSEIKFPGAKALTPIVVQWLNEDSLCVGFDDSSIKCLSIKSRSVKVRWDNKFGGKCYKMSFNGERIYVHLRKSSKVILLDINGSVIEEIAWSTQKGTRVTPLPSGKVVTVMYE